MPTQTPGSLQYLALPVQPVLTYRLSARTVALIQMLGQQELREEPVRKIDVLEGHFCFERRFGADYVIFKSWPNRLTSRHTFAKAELVYGHAMGGQTDSQVGSQVYASHKSCEFHVYAVYLQSTCVDVCPK